jgi:hypothetical protein
MDGFPLAQEKLMKLLLYSLGDLGPKEAVVLEVPEVDLAHIELLKRANLACPCFFLPNDATHL